MQKEIDAYIVIAQQEWALNLGSNARNLAIEFSKKYPVMYVNPAMDVNTSIKQVASSHGRKRIGISMGWSDNTIKAADNLWIHTPATMATSINWLRSASVYDLLSRRNALSFYKSLAKAIKKLGWRKEHCVVFNDSQMFTGLYTKSMLSPLMSFYYIRDNLIEHPYFKFHGSRIEPKTVGSADAVFANSAYLADYASHYNNKSYDIGQGCELEIYDPAAQYVEPADEAAIPHPRIGYIGFLTGERLDITLLENLATAKPEWSFVMIGPEEIMFQQSALHKMQNVYFLGSKKPDQLPAYTQYLDVCINPQSINPLTVGNYPRKIDEYLAMGKPTVATATPAMKMFLPHVHLATSKDEYIQAIENAMKPVTSAERNAAINFAKSHTWKACTDKIYSIQNELLHA